MRQRLRLLVLLLVVLSLPLFGGTLPAGADLPPPLGALANEVFPGQPDSLARALKISTGGAHSCAVTHDGDAYCWGNNSSGQLGDGTTTQRSTPVKVLVGAGLSDGTFADISAGGEHTCAVTVNGDAYCWGNNASGQLGDGTIINRSAPTAVAAGAGITSGTVEQISAGTSHTCVATQAGDAYCWGSNGSGQVGDGTTTDRSSPIKVLPGAGLDSGTVAAIRSGGDHTCAFTNTGAGYCWGSNSHGQLGDGTTADRSAPVGVVPASGPIGGPITDMTAGHFHSCSLTILGQAYCWGRNSDGQLGDGSATSRTSPVAVQRGDGLVPGTAVAITAGGDHTRARTLNTEAYCWGYNAYGQLGDGTSHTRLAPVRVGSGATGSAFHVVRIDTDHRHTCAIDEASDAHCWGSGELGRLGNGTTTDRHSPTAVAAMAVPGPGHCDDPTTRVDEFTYSDAAHTFQVDIHQKSDGVYTCVYAERNGHVLLDEVVRVPGDVVTIDEDAPPGDGPDSPCTERRQGGNSQHRAYAGTTPSDTYPVVVCAGLTSSTAGNHHVRIVIG